VVGDGGYLVPPGDPGALADALLLLLGSDDLRARLGAGGRRRVLDRFTWRATAVGTAEQYAALLEMGASASQRAGAPRAGAPGSRAQRRDGAAPC
jgi:glycosyltransferase involved in cell wall biosynthesis